jgi:CubicO group peptidase (beta-lactamase class C family)
LRDRAHRAILLRRPTHHTGILVPSPARRLFTINGGTVHVRFGIAALFTGLTVIGGTDRAPASASRAGPPVTAAELDALIRRAVADKHLVGLSVGVMQDGKVILAKGYGQRSIESKDTVTPETMFAIGSVTKQFTCSAMLLLDEEKKLSTADPVAKYLPSLTRAGDITLLDLGQHVSGYRDYYPLDFVDQEMQKPTTAEAIMQEYATRPLDFDPGTRWSYSNTNFIILGRIIEMAGGEPFGDFLAHRFFTPLGMAHTQYSPSDADARMARGYTSFALGAPIPAAPEAQGWPGSAGAIWSTPTDLLAWDLALVDGKVLSPASYHTLTTPRRLADGRSTGYGCGEGVRDRGDALVLTHGGAVSGFIAQNTVIPATRSAVVLLANTDFAAVDALNQALVNRLLPHVDVPAVQGAPALAAAKVFLSGLQKGTVDRSTLGSDFDAYLTPALLAGARTTLKEMGPVTGVEVRQTVERGGMEVAILRFKIGNQDAQALMYRTPDGKIQEFLMSRE